MKFIRKKHNSLKVIDSFLYEHDTSHIHYNSSLSCVRRKKVNCVHTFKKYNYNIIRQQSHDGTLYVSMQLYIDVFSPLLDQSSFWKPDEPVWDKLDYIKYTVGDLKEFKVFGQVQLPVGEYLGERQRMVLPVQCEYIYK